MICRLIDKGSFGQVFKVIDLEEKEKPLAMKLQPTSHLFEKEIRALKSIWNRRQSLKIDMNLLSMCKTPEIITSGLINLDDTSKLEKPRNEDATHAYIMMPRFG